MANELGLDTAFGTVINPATVDLIVFGIPRIGTFGYGKTGTTAYYNKSLSIDSGFLPTVNNLLNAGKWAGCYIFSYAWDTTSAVAEADRVCDYLDLNGVNLNLPVFFDWERTGPGTYGSYEMVTAAGVTVTPNLVQNMTVAFMHRVVQRGRRAGWYNSKGDLDSWFGDAVDQIRAQPEKYCLWMAQWGNGYTGYLPDVWQYAGDTTFNGVPCDLNRAITTRFFDGTIPPKPPDGVPLWVLMKLSENNKRRGYIIRI